MTPSVNGAAPVRCILREWRAEIRRNLKQEYLDYVMDTGVAEYLMTPGNLGALVSMRDLDAERTEMVILSWWRDRECIKAFAGEDIDEAHYYAEDDRFLLTRPRKVTHYMTLLSLPTAR